MSSRATVVMAATLVALLALAGCDLTPEQSTDTPEAEQVTSAPADVESITKTATPSPTPTATSQDSPGEISQRGALVKEVGEAAGLYTTDPDDPWLEFEVTDITVDGECAAEFSEPPENGHFVFVTISASTSSEWPPDLQGITIDFSSFDWTIVGEDGLSESSLDSFASYSCLPDDELMPVNGVGPGENIVGTLVLDTANPAGVLVYRPWFGTGTNGWEWEY